MRKSTILNVFGLAIACSSALEAQFTREPGDDDRRLEFLVGEWSVESTMYFRGESHSQVSRAVCYWVIDSLWVQCDRSGTFPDGRKIQSSEWLTWNEVEGRYRSFHIDSQLAQTIESSGDFTDEGVDGGVLALEASFTWRDGNTYYARETIELRDDGSVARKSFMAADPDPESMKLNGESVFRPASAAEAVEAVGGPAYDALAWLSGHWEAQFRPGGEDQPAPTMSFEWGDAKRSFLRMKGTRPTPDGRLVPEYESVVVWNPVLGRFVFLGSYLSGAGRIMEDGDLDLLEGGAVRLNMRVRYPAGATLPFSEGATAGSDGHTLEFRRTFHREGDDGLRGVFLIKRGGRWENPHPEMGMDDGYPWKRVSDGR